MATLTAEPLHRDANPPAVRAVGIWLYIVAALVFAMVIAGGATRLTRSGLSITEWQPILGVIPPLNEADWLAAFEKYKQIPQYQLLNKGMTLADFKFIYAWEWGHRLLGRLIGVAFFIPFLVFWISGAIRRTLWAKLAALFVLGGMQGALGWYMVASGLVDRVSVSQYRLAAHLGLAVVLFGLLLWFAMGITTRAQPALQRHAHLFWMAILTLAFVYIQIILGGFVAGLDAGRAMDTWPLMGDSFVPAGIGELTPWYLNLFENPVTVQFDHRVIGYAAAVIALVQFAAVCAVRTLRLTASLLAAAVLVQAVLGILTITHHVPLHMALTHQGAALAVFGLAVWHLHRCHRLR
jgi:cytochrome c oxidase assembly protein subunit 15